MENNIVRQIYCSKFIYLYIHSVRAHLYCKRISLVCEWFILHREFLVDLARKCLTEYCERCKNRIRGREGGLLQLAVCTGGLLLLVQQARKRMSQPAECAGN